MSNINGKKLLSVAALMSLAVLTMANQQCKQEPVKARSLKKNVQVLKVEASSFLDNAGFNFSEVAQSQFSGVIFEEESMFERNIYPKPEQLTQAAAATGMQKATVEDKQMVQLKTWFPTMKASDVELSRDSSCLVSRPQHFLYGKINSLEAYSGAALQFGFNSTAVQIPLTAKFKMDKMRMDLSFHAYDPWSSQQMAATNSAVTKTDYSVGFGIDLGIIHIGPEFYRVTGMAETVLKGLKQSLADISAKLKSLDRQEWHTRVLISRDNYVVIVGGAELGLKKGDRLKVENEVHDWMGAPCGEGSTLLGSVSVTNDPWIIEVEDAGDLMSKARVLNPREDDSIEVGALTRVSTLYVEPVSATQAKK
ncbi:hypothetical protein CIK05_12505 [Bdellovibrio sp. qaytius]|nr:hypothetical protein CIK05_12505 [Bdellovibrio sp. qaytius]